MRPTCWISYSIPRILNAIPWSFWWMRYERALLVRERLVQYCFVFVIGNANIVEIFRTILHAILRVMFFQYRPWIVARSLTRNKSGKQYPGILGLNFVSQCMSAVFHFVRYYTWNDHAFKKNVSNFQWYKSRYCGMVARYLHFVCWKCHLKTHQFSEGSSLTSVVWIYSHIDIWV